MRHQQQQQQRCLCRCVSGEALFTAMTGYWRFEGWLHHVAVFRCIEIEQHSSAQQRRLKNPVVAALGVLKRALNTLFSLLLLSPTHLADTAR